MTDTTKMELTEVLLLPYTAIVALIAVLLVLLVDVYWLFSSEFVLIQRSGALFLSIGVLFVLRDVQGKIGAGICSVVEGYIKKSYCLYTEDELRLKLSRNARLSEVFIIIFGTFASGYGDLVSGYVFLICLN